MPGLKPRPTFVHARAEAPARIENQTGGSAVKQRSRRGAGEWVKMRAGACIGFSPARESSEAQVSPEKDSGLSLAIHSVFGPALRAGEVLHERAV